MSQKPFAIITTDAVPVVHHHPMAAIKRLGRYRPPADATVHDSQAVRQAAADSTVAEIRERYPDARPLQWGIPAPDGGYDVGGALCMFFGEQTPYPSYKVLGRLLARLNPDLDTIGANNWARLIIHAYECEKFRDPWDTLREALWAREGPS